MGAGQCRPRFLCHPASLSSNLPHPSPFVIRRPIVGVVWAALELRHWSLPTVGSTRPCTGDAGSGPSATRSDPSGAGGTFFHHTSCTDMSAAASIGAAQVFSDGRESCPSPPRLPHPPRSLPVQSPLCTPPRPPRLLPVWATLGIPPHPPRSSSSGQRV
jgi:hypothetical protein